MADGTTTSYPAGSNVYIETLPNSGPTPVSITWTSDGTQHSAPSSVAAGAQNQACIHPNNLPPASQLPHTTPGVVTTPSSAATTAP
jgi:hypothetical protein